MRCWPGGPSAPGARPQHWSTGCARRWASPPSTAEGRCRSGSGAEVVGPIVEGGGSGAVEQAQGQQAQPGATAVVPAQVKAGLALALGIQGGMVGVVGLQDGQGVLGEVLEGEQDQPGATAVVRA